ncbi:hypothetical protein [Endozoicomonas sp. 8E]|uniref:hypothetical protein n=1 Tax=Endozoicomonas sp. 8E TaxID=3035692 RepID=UPI0029393B1A|nr:hypothetical protein [Endozoicomonas sp. 8E]WOG28877.1 hypothetical protein P6910_04230 [Endozoicomonas sp. 8E]
MSNNSKFVDEALSDIDDLFDNDESIIKIKLTEQQIEMAKKLQAALHLSKDVFFNTLANYGAYSCSKDDFDENEFPSSMEGVEIDFNVSTESETELEKHPEYMNELITVFGLIKMSQSLL